MSTKMFQGAAGSITKYVDVVKVKLSSYRHVGVKVRSI
jgi:hypothetical protein